MTDTLKINKPQPIKSVENVHLFDRGSNLKKTIELLEAQEPVLITEFYSNGLELLQEVRKHLDEKLPNKSFQEQREFRSAYREMTQRILIEIVAQKLAVKKAPSIGWLQRFYPEQESFLLPFTQVQGLNSSWQWYKNGINIPVLRNKLHPYFGVYFPTRFDHLILFDDWLKRYDGPKKAAIDIGTGSGVLALQLVKHGFQKVFGTDTNPNAIVGLKEYMGDTKLSRKIELDFGDLFGKWKKQTELIVFNPPWLPKSHDLDKIDEAIYYDEDLFTSFFTQAKERLHTDGKLVILFSNLARITNLTNEHPIENELANGARFKLEQTFTKKVKAASKQTKRDQHWRSEEEVELWVLVHDV